ncbi:hypothetical protein SARC_04371 [Sphaeroforma arctica JP610]|uniref:Uncharacterized protein n=1 Tax=Sphaeroforma arctica JP610 TaxID=667725 RepID=A0A0L0G525_9EUKA|nr:hypothetical protein SARC_04371 [Sphaeroforma arctica JP610]KNC83363.1 hypothetical protein SARC_04371 [Sphaeroforma arctica JP610]|eukprot:XP_014157265.1 hypothetical protein SARC_04371 [Sphaeroforma arctica JP610]
MSAQECPGLNAFIPPTVEMNAGHYEDLIAAKKGPIVPKEKVVEHLLSGKAQPMHMYFAPAYLATNHFDWMFSNKVTEIPYLTRFEPYYIARKSLPYFDETFINRGGNYAEQVYEMAAGGYRFFRLPHAFTVDIPHSKVEDTELAKSTISTDNLRVDDHEQLHVDKDENRGHDEKDEILASKEEITRIEPKADPDVLQQVQQPPPDKQPEDETQTDPDAFSSEKGFENETKQNIHNEDFTTTLWENLSQLVADRYQTGAGQTFIGTRPTRCYRHNIGHFSETLWGLFKGEIVPSEVPKRFLDRVCYKK